jgi:hypothetical protein
MRIQGLIGAAVASVVVVGLGAIASIASYMSRVDSDGTGGVRVAVAAKPLERGCSDCGVIVAVRPIELRGKAVEPARIKKRYQIQVRMSDGSVKTVTYNTEPTWKAGDRVRLQNGRLIS